MVSFTTEAQTGTLVCAPVATAKGASAPFDRYDNALMVVKVTDTTKDFTLIQDFTKADFKDASFDGSLTLLIKGMRFDATGPASVRNKFILNLSYSRQTPDLSGTEFVTSSGYTQGTVFEPLTSVVNILDSNLENYGATCLFF